MGTWYHWDDSSYRYDCICYLACTEFRSSVESKQRVIKSNRNFKTEHFRQFLHEYTEQLSLHVWGKISEGVRNDYERPPEAEIILSVWFRVSKAICQGRSNWAFNIYHSNRTRPMQNYNQYLHGLVLDFPGSTHGIDESTRLVLMTSTDEVA